mmetsp:Transcript_21340/g.42934  ORF Transcript_21340/g.42934 Transcript_21340/m.42934 type:complete len:383 (-) Transcript_21340:92-1240(-)
MRFAHVDCTDDKVLCQRFGVQGYPTIKLFLPGGDMAAPLQYRTQRTEEGFVKYAERMMRPPILQMSSAGDVEQLMQDESYASFIAIAGSATEAPSGFGTAASTWRDRHIFAVAKAWADVLPKEALGSNSTTRGATLVVFSSGAQQWPGAERSAKAGPAVEYFVGDDDDAEVIGEWVAKHRFPGIWSLSDGNFYEFTHSGRRVVMVIVDPAAVTRSQEKNIRSVAHSLRSDYIFGVVDGVAWAEELADFNIRTSELPRVMVTEKDFEAWYEDSEILTLDALEQELNALTAGTSTILRQSRSAGSRLMFYKREIVRWTVWLRRYSHRGPKELAIALSLTVGVVALIASLGWCLGACCRVLLEDDSNVGVDSSAKARSPRHTKRD